MARATRLPVEAEAASANDYQVETVVEQKSQPFGMTLLRALRGLIVIILIAASVGLFVVVGSLLGLF